MNVTIYRAQAQANISKPASQLRPGDFIYCLSALGKALDFTDWIGGAQIMDGGPGRILCKIVEVIDTPAGADLLTGWMGRPTPAHRGGSESADVPEGKKPWEYTRDEIATFYNLVTVYRNGRGQWLAVDCQGYDYWRYVYLPTGFRTIFAAEHAEALAELRRREEARAHAHAAELRAHADALAARYAELRALYPELKEGADTARAVGANVRKFFKKHFPSLTVKVSVRANYWGNAWDVSVDAPRDTPPAIRDNVSQACQVWADYMPSGEWREGDHGHFEPGVTPMARLFGNVEYGIRPSYCL